METNSLGRYKAYFLLLLIFSFFISVTACSQSNHAEDPYFTIPKKLSASIEHSFTGNVIIVGSGAAGLSAANVLENSKVDYIVLEASHRYGGRIKENDTFADFPIDLGAEWIHNKSAVLNRLKGSNSDKPIEGVVLYQPKNVYTWNGKNYKKISKKYLENLYDVMEEYKFKRSTWFDFIETNYAQKVKNHIVYNSPVAKIDYTGEQVVITTKNGKKYTADKVIITVSIGMLQSGYISFNPALPKKKIEAIDSVIFPKGFKLFMRFSEKFYPDMIYVDSSSGEKTYYDVAYHKEAKDNVLGLLSTGASSEYYYKLDSEQKIVDNVLKELDKIFDGKATKAYLGKYKLENWGRKPFILGTWTENDDDDDDDDDDDKSAIKWLNAPLNNKVYFAGETYDPHYRSTVHGAIISGNKKAIELLKGK